MANPEILEKLFAAEKEGQRIVQEARDKKKEYAIKAAKEAESEIEAMEVPITATKVSASSILPLLFCFELFDFSDYHCAQNEGVSL